MDRTKALHGPRPKPLGKPTTQTKELKFWTEPRPCLVLGPKPLGKPTTYRKNISFGQNQGLAWSSDPSLWGNQLLKRKNTSFGQNQGLAWSFDPSLWGSHLLRRNKTSLQGSRKFWPEPSLWGKPPAYKEKLGYVNLLVYPRTLKAKKANTKWSNMFPKHSRSCTMLDHPLK